VSFPITFGVIGLVMLVLAAVNVADRAVSAGIRLVGALESTRFTRGRRW
jgi:hypothetical protein